MSDALELLIEKRRRRAIRSGDVLSWCEHALAPVGQSPAEHHRLLIRELQAVADGKVDRLMVIMPPGSAKSTYSTVLFPAAWYQSHPRGQIISASYNQEKANEFSEMVMRNVRENRLVLGYGFGRERMVGWDITSGGTYRAVGIGGPVTGRRADLIIIDDPVKSQEEADSEKVRKSTWAWYSSDLYTRLKPGGAIILVQTRWHEDDLAGRLLEGMKQGRDQWRVVNLPAIAEGNDPLGRKSGAALWPAWQDETALARIRRNIGERGWTSLYQGQPRPTEGSIIKASWWRPWTAPLTKPDITVVSLDLAYTEKRENDPSACTVWDVTTGEDFRSKCILRFAWAERLEFPDLIPALLETVKAYKKPGIPLVVLIEGKGPGLSLVQELRRRVPTLGIHTVAPAVSKTARAHSVTAMFQEGVVHVVASIGEDTAGEAKAVLKPWAEMVINECAAFPLGAHDDLTDTVTQLLRYVRDSGFELHAEDAPAPPKSKPRAPLY